MEQVNLKIDHGLTELEIGVMNGGLQFELYDLYNFYIITMALSLDEIRKIRDTLNTVLESENET